MVANTGMFTSVADAQAYIQQRASAFNLDPAAVIAVAQGEGLSAAGIAGAHPDPTKGAPNAFAVGPFQLNSAGALSRSPAAGLSQSAASAWAWSTDGIDWALGQIKQVAGGQNGSQAITNIVTYFEIPSDIPGSIGRAVTRLTGHAQPTTGGQTQTPAQTTTTAGAEPGTSPSGGGGATTSGTGTFGDSLLHLLITGALIFVALVLVIMGAMFMITDKAGEEVEQHPEVAAAAVAA